MKQHLTNQCSRPLTRRLIEALAQYFHWGNVLIKVNWSSLLDKQGLIIHYRACSERDAWRKPPKHKTLRKALFEEFGVRELFRFGSKLNRKRTKSYGPPFFAAVWIEGEPWALLIKERVAAIVPASVVQQYDGPPAIPSKKRTTSEYVNEVRTQLSGYFDSATKNLLLDESDFTNNVEFDLNSSSGEKEESSDVDVSSELITRATSKQEDSESPDELQAYYLMLDEEIEQAFSNREDRRLRLLDAQKIPQTFNVQATIYKRNPDVIAEVLDRANGICEECGNPALFLRARNDLPYLEVHHRNLLSKGGEDSVENAIALCPNCHRRFHYGHA